MAVTLLIAALAACAAEESPTPQGEAPAGTSGSPSTGSPSDTASPSASDTATATASPTSRPLSRFEGEPTVRAAREFAAGIGQAINDNDASLSAMTELLSAQGQQKLPALVSEDLGQLYPGPLPFTPVRVEVDGDRAVLRTCMQTSGWGMDPDTNLPARPLVVRAIDIPMVQVDGRWLVEDLWDGTAQCRAVSVKGVAW